MSILRTTRGCERGIGPLGLLETRWVIAWSYWGFLLFVDKIRIRLLVTLTHGNSPWEFFVVFLLELGKERPWFR